MASGWLSGSGRARAGSAMTRPAESAWLHVSSARARLWRARNAPTPINIAGSRMLCKQECKDGCCGCCERGKDVPAGRNKSNIDALSEQKITIFFPSLSRGATGSRHTVALAVNLRKQSASLGSKIMFSGLGGRRLGAHLPFFLKREWANYRDRPPTSRLPRLPQ